MITGRNVPKALPSSSANIATTNSDCDCDDSDEETRITIASYINSGASRTMCSHRDWFHPSRQTCPRPHVALGNNKSIPAIRTGCTLIHVQAKAPGGTNLTSTTAGEG